jgi:DNA-binding MurR/RpiR family transcriptional regulator
MILEKIRQVYPELTKSQKKLADFIANSYQEAAFMTASRLARRLDVNEATVIRFAQRLGYPGFPELIHDVQAIVQEELKTRGEGEGVAAPEEPLVVVLKNEMEALQRAVSHVSADLAHRLTALLRGTRRIYAVGEGLSYHLAGLLALGLAGLGHDARAVTGDPASLAVALADLEGTDALIGIALGSEDTEIARALRAARDRGARTLAITASPISKSAQVADVALTSPADDLFAMPSFAVAATFADALAQAVAGFDPEGAQRYVQAVEEVSRQLRG